MKVIITIEDQPDGSAIVTRQLEGEQTDDSAAFSLGRLMFIPNVKKATWLEKALNWFVIAWASLVIPYLVVLLVKEFFV